MKTTIRILVSVAAAFLVANVSSAQPADRAALVARGRYLVENVGLCADCHSPRSQTGAFVPGMELKGAPLVFAPTVPMPAWAGVAPAIAGLPTMNEEEAAKFLHTGMRPNGTVPLPPMPSFRFSEADAAAVAAYLKSLGH